MGTKIFDTRDEVIPHSPLSVLKKGNGFFQHFPGVYCKQCGEMFALYSYSASQPHGIDEKGKPFYNNCFKCKGSIYKNPEVLNVPAKT